ncbi:hypothetical protein Tco_0706118 [Tanacetum coccineum]|uniref:Reverse transcriptase domain-containing protein n=1 Tax=Tanacetum coccineum TaxID=301880 RepID=A0ABQ4Y7D6_9ASTR
MDLKTKLETATKNHQASIQNLKAKFDILAYKQSAQPFGSIPSKTQPNPKGSSSKAYQPPQAQNEHVNVVFTRSGKSYDPPINPNDQPNDSETPVNFDSDDEDEEPTPQPKVKDPKPVKETPIPKPYKPKNPYPQRLRKEKMEAQYEEDFDALLDEGSKILHSIKRTILEEKLFAEFDEFMAMTADENSECDSKTEEPPFEKITFNTDYKIKTSLEDPPSDLKLKPLPDNLEYVFLEEPSFLPVIISSKLSEQNKNKCMLAIFHDMIEESVEVFMDGFSVFGNSFDNCLKNLNKMLQRCKDANLVLNWEKCHFMVKEEIMLGHKVSGVGLEVDKAKIDVISKLPPPTNVKGIRSFLGHDGFYGRFFKDFSKITRPLTKLLEKDTPFGIQ